jgi:hypothetical protein
MTNHPDEDEDEFGTWWSEPDVDLILRLLKGTTHKHDYRILSNGLKGHTLRRLTPEEIRESCKALANLLRTRKLPVYKDARLSRTEAREALCDVACHQLADLIDPDCKGVWKVRFKRSRGELAQPNEQAAVVFAVWCLRKWWLLRKGKKLPLEDAFDQVGNKYGLSDKRVRKFWYGPLGARYRSRPL